MSTTKPAVNPFDYRTDFTPLERLRYILAVCEAAERGENVEIAMILSSGKPLEWVTCIKPVGSDLIARDFTESYWAYRIARPKIAAGHNPAGLSEDQVGVKDGWRLLSKEEVEANDSDRKHKDGIQMWLTHRKKWESGPFIGDLMGSCYRTKNPPSHYLPKSAPVKTLRAWTFETAPKGCVLVRNRGQDEMAHIITGWHSAGVMVGPAGERTYAGLLAGEEHSIDGGATWSDCGTYVEGRP